MSDTAAYLTVLARRIADAYIACTDPTAILLTGSVASGECDRFSDLDLIVYHETLPLDQALREARQRVERADPWRNIERREVGFLELFVVAGVECQVAHSLVADWEAEIAATLVGAEVASLSQKKLMGLVEGKPLHGDEVIGRWQEQASRYSAALARATIEYYLRQLFPLWYFSPRLTERDATLWIASELVEAAHAIIGIVAALNRRYFSPFQFKHQRRFIAALALTPANLADRLDALFAVPPLMALAPLEALVRDTLALVHVQMPEIDHAALPRKPGEREAPWNIPREI